MGDKKKAIWITGASSGIGRALTIKFAENGFIVLGTARRFELLEEIKKEFPGNFYPFKLDVADSSSIEKFFYEISDSVDIECLINNAGVTSFKNAVDNSVDEIKKIIETNLLGSIYTIKTVLPGMIEQNGGTIINILSVVTEKIFTASSAYSASKSGLLAYTKVLREEVRDNNIRIINVSPGATITPIWSDGVLKKYSERMMNPESIARIIFSLYSEKGNLVTEDVVIRPIKGDL
jgi:3-oxoacyl-[acyl-carrier protein] reductase